MGKGKVIVLEGQDGSGKETRKKRLSARLTKEGIPHITVSFPNYGQPSAAMVEKYLSPKGGLKNIYGEDNITFVKQASTFYTVDRVGTLIESINGQPSIIELVNSGVHLICDRYTTSNLLHQVGNLSNPEHIEEYVHWAENLEYSDLGMPKPDLVLFLNVTPEISMENMRKRYKDVDGKDIHENLGHLSRVFARKDTVIDMCGWHKIECCDDTGKMKDYADLDALVYDEAIKILK